MESLADALQNLGEGRPLLPLLCVLCLNCSLEAFKTFVSPYLYGKRASSPSKFLRRQARQEIYESFFAPHSSPQIGQTSMGNHSRNNRTHSPKHNQQSRLSSEHDYLEFAQMLRAHSARWGEFLPDEVLTIILLIDQQVNGYVRWETIDAFSSLLDGELQQDPTHPELVLSNLFLALVTQAYDHLQLEAVPIDIKSRVRDLLKAVRRRTNIQPLELLLRHAAAESPVSWSEADPGNAACVHAVQAMLDAVRPPAVVEIRTPTPAAGVTKPRAAAGVIATNEQRLSVADLRPSPAWSPPRASLSPPPAPASTSAPSPAEAKALLRSSLRSLETRARELSDHLDAADDALLADQSLWAQLRDLGQDLSQALHVEGVLSQSQTSLLLDSSAAEPPGATPHEDTVGQVQPTTPGDEDGNGAVGTETDADVDGDAATTNSTLTASVSAPRRLFSPPRTRPLGPSTLTYEGLMAMNQSHGSAGMGVGNRSIGQKSLSQSEALRMKFQHQYAHIKEIYDIRVTPKKKVNLGIIKSPSQRQQSGNVNYYDARYMRWQASQRRHNPHDDRILDVDDYKTLQYQRQAYSMFHHSR